MEAQRPLEKRSYARVTGTRRKRDSRRSPEGRVREDEYNLDDEFTEGCEMRRRRPRLLLTTRRIWRSNLLDARG